MVEMENQALQHVMNVQTQMLQHLTNLQQQQSRNEVVSASNPIQGPNTLIGTPLPNSIASPVIPPSVDPTLAPGTLSMAASDPTKYGTYGATPYLGDGRPKVAADNLTPRSFIKSSLEQMRNYDATRQSKESTAQFISQQSRGFQEQTVDVVGGALSGAASVGSFFIPGGIVASTLVGGGAALGIGGLASAMNKETRTALDYQDMLQQQSYRFMNAFESTSEMGGIGMALSDRQDLSRFMRDLAPDKFLKDQEMMGILEGATDNNLLKSVNDVKSFKKKFTEVVDAVKEITITMNQSIEEATRFMGEMESRGISTKDMSYISARTKTMSSMLGISATEGAQIVLQGSDNVVSGTSINSNFMMQSTAENVYLAQRIQDYAKGSNQELYDYMKNSGGADSVALAYQQQGRDFIRSERGTEMLLGMYGGGLSMNPQTGEVEINRNAMQGLLSGKTSVQEMQRKSQDFMAGLSAAEKRRLQGTIGTMFSNFASNEDMALFMERTAGLIVERQAQAGNTIDMETALIEAGIAGDYEQAKLFNNMIDASKNRSWTQGFTAKSIKEEMDAHAISNSPGLVKRIQFGWEKNVTNVLGNVGQNVSDTVGNVLLEHEKFITGIDDRSTVGATHLEDLSQEGLLKMVERLEGFNDTPKKIAKEYGFSPDLFGGQIEVEQMRKQLKFNGTESLDSGMYDFYLSQANKGKLDAATLAQIQPDDYGAWNGVQSMRAQLIQDAATGKYDGFIGKLEYGMDRATVGAWGYIGDLVDKTIIEPFQKDTSSLGKFNDAKGSYKSLEKQKEKLMDAKEDINKDVMSLFGSGDLGKNKGTLKTLEALIESGDVDGVRGLTKNKEAVELAKRYQKLQGLEKEYSEDMGTFDELAKYTKAVATTGTQLGDLLAASGIYDETEINDLVGDVRSAGNKTNKKLGKKKMSATEMVQANRDTINELDAMFDKLPEYQMQELAKYLTSKDRNITMDSFYLKDTSVIDENALQKYIMNNVIKQSHLKNDADQAPNETKDSKKVAGDHKDAMYDFLSAFQEETRMLREAVAGVPISYPNQVSLSTSR